MTRTWAFLLCGLMPVMAGEMPGKAAGYHEALRKRPESEALFTRFRDAWLEEKPAEGLEAELLARAEAGEAGGWGILGRERLAAGKDEEALAAFGKAIEAEPNSAWLRMARAKLLLAKKDFAAAEKDAMAVPEGDKLRPEALKLAGLACLRGDKVDAALAHWKKAVDAAPGDKGLLEDLTELTRREGRNDLALDFCAKWRDATDDAYGKAMATLKRSELLLASQRFDEAMKELGEVLKVSGDGSWLEREALARAEQIHQQRNDATGWVKQITTWADANPVRLNFRRTQAQALAVAGRTTQALAVLDDVLKRVPGDRDARWQRISLLERDLKVQQAFDECAAMAEEEKSEEVRLRLAELAFRLEKKDEVKKALDAVIAAADPAKRINLAGLYARYGLPEESEKQWRALAGGETGGQALRELAKHLRTERRDKEALEVWKEIGRRDFSHDRIEAAQALAGAGEKEAARVLLEEGRERFSSEPAYEAARAELALMQGRALDAQKIYRELAARAKRPEEMQIAVKGWLGAVAGHVEEALKELGEETGDRCLRAALLAESGQPLPELKAGDEIEKAVRLALLREHSKWPEVVALLESSGGSGPLYFSDLLDAKSAAGDTRGAVAAAKAWRERTPDQPAAWMKESSLLIEQGKIAEAEVLLRRAVARFDDDENVGRALFLLLEKNGGAPEALELAWQRHDQAADAAAKAGWLREIIRVSKEGDLTQSLRERLEERTRRDPVSPGPWLALADLAKTQEAPQKELELMLKAVACAPRDVAAVSRLAAIEEKMGRSDRALERYVELARLVPGKDSARQLAQAKLRCGDVAGGMRDLQTLAGDQGIDVRSLESTIFDLAARGYVEEASRLFGFLDPGLVDARAHYLWGVLLEIDGREADALEHYLKVMMEPNDPAEGKGYGRDGQNLMMLLGSRGEHRVASPQQLSVPASLAEAKLTLRQRIVEMAELLGGEAWEKAIAVLPWLKGTSPEHWSEVTKFADDGDGLGEVQWLDFIHRFPGNPLGPEFLFESNQYAACTPEQARELLQRKPPVSLRLGLSLQLALVDKDPQAIDWLKNVEPAAWRDDIAAELLTRYADQLLSKFEGGRQDDVEARSKLEGVMAVLKMAELGERQERPRHVLLARQALLGEDAEAFLSQVRQALAAPAASEMEEVRGSYGISTSIVAGLMQWKASKGGAAFEELVKGLPSPALRSLADLGNLDDKDATRNRIEKEIAALPADAPRETRRELIRLRWQFGQVGRDRDGFEKMLEAASNDESDPRLALEALTRLTAIYSITAEAKGRVPENQRRIEAMARRLMASSESDRTFVQQMGWAYGRNSSHAAGPVTRWGAAAHGSNYYGYSNNGGVAPIVRRIVALEDRQMAVREAADLLESLARGSMGRSGMLQEAFGAFRGANLLDEALGKISVPEDAGLSRRVAALLLMESSGEKEKAKSIVTGIHRMRPWDVRWAVKLAFLVDDREEAFRLLDEAANRPSFTVEFLKEFFGQGGSSEPGMEKYAVLAEWMERPLANRSALGPVTVSLGIKVAEYGANEAGQGEMLNQLTAFYQRFGKLSLTNQRSSELAFRSLYATMRRKDVALVEGAARQALLSGAYKLSDLGLGGLSVVGIPEAPASLEWLVIAAKEKGDDAVFTPEFRAQLKAIDADSDAWIGKMLSTKRATELPDVIRDPGIMDSGSLRGVALARHEAAMLRAIQLPGREDLLDKIFRENLIHTVSGNVVHVVRESLKVAAKDKRLEKRVLSLMEMAAGPRKEWKTADSKLASAAGMIVQAAQSADSGQLVAVLNTFASWEVSSQAGDPSEMLAMLWRRDLGAPLNAKVSELPGTRLREALLTGYWRAAPATGDGKPRQVFQWTFQDSVRLLASRMSAMAGSSIQDLTRTVSDNPKATFFDLLRAEALTSDKDLSKRALKIAMPELEKVPAGVRDAVIDKLTFNFELLDVEGLPKPVADRLRTRLQSQIQAKVKQTRERFAQMQGPGRMPLRADEAGRLAGSVIVEEPELAEEIAAAWRSKQPKITDQDFNLFALGIFNGCGKSADDVFLRLAMIDRLWAGAPPAWTGNSEDPFSMAWGLLSWGKLPSPGVWPRVSKLSPRMQVRLMLGAHTHFRAQDINDKEWLKRSREAAKGAAMTHHALGWFVEMDDLEDHPKSRSTGIAPLGFLEAMKGAGATPEELAVLMEQMFKRLFQIDNGVEIMKRTPDLLAGINGLPQSTASEMVEGVLSLWGRTQLQWQESGKLTGEVAWKTPVHPVETAAFFRFVMANVQGGKPERYFTSSRATSALLALDDDELIERCMGTSKVRLAGDAGMIFRLLRKDRVKEALELLPPPGQNQLSSSSASYSKETEALIGKLAAVDSAEAFRLRVLISKMSDERGDDAPSEGYRDRLKRLADEYEKKRGGFTPTDRMALCSDLELTSKAGSEHVPMLDEFTGEMATKEFQSIFHDGPQNRISGFAIVCAAAAKSRFHAGDFSGMEAFAEAIRKAAPGEQMDGRVRQWLPGMTQCFWHAADRHDAKLPDAEAAAVRSFAAALATREDPEIRAEASRLVYLAASDVASLKAGLESCKLEGVVPGRLSNRERMGFNMADPCVVRVSLMHPLSAELAKVMERPSAITSQSGMILSVLKDARVRAKLDPAMFLDWTRYTSAIPALYLEGVKAYAAERRGDFDEGQRAQLDAVLKRMEGQGRGMDRELQRKMQMEMREEMEKEMKGRPGMWGPGMRPPIR